jgi:hypothetical protein
LFGRSFVPVRHVVRGGIAFFHCELDDGTVGQVPVWMTDAAVCAQMTVGPSQISIAALTELRLLLDAVSTVKSIATPEAVPARASDGSLPEPRSARAARDSTALARGKVPFGSRKEGVNDGESNGATEAIVAEVAFGSENQAQPRGAERTGRGTRRASSRRGLKRAKPR